VILLITIVTQDGLLFAKLVEAVTASAVTTQFDFADIQANRAIKERSRETIQDTNSLGVRHYFFDWLFLLCRLHNTTLFLREIERETGSTLAKNGRDHSNQ
jgi:hypothetical protein